MRITYSIRYEDAIEKLTKTKAEIEQVESEMKALIRILNGLGSSKNTAEHISSLEKLMKEYEEKELKLVNLVNLELALTEGIRELEEEARNKEREKCIQEEEKSELGRISAWKEKLQQLDLEHECLNERNRMLNSDANELGYYE